MDKTDNFITAPSSVRYQQPQSSPLGRLLLGGEHGRDTLTSPQLTFRKWRIYSAVLILNGRARYSNEDGHAQQVGTGDLMLMFPDQGYRYFIEPGQSWQELYLQFDGPVFDLWQRSGILDKRNPVWHLQPLAEWAGRIRHLMRPVQGCTPLQRVCELQDVLAAAADAQRQPLSAAADHWADTARLLLDSAAEAPVADWLPVAQRLGLSPDRFRKKFLQITGDTPFKYIAHRRIDRASVLLRESDLLIKQIAHICGFPDEFHFSRRFKQVMGLSPAAYREATRQDITDREPQVVPT